MIKRHEIVIDETVYRGGLRYAARCVTCPVELHRPSTMLSRAVLVQAAHQYAMELLARGAGAEQAQRVVVDLPKVVRVVPGVRAVMKACWCGRKACACAAGCKSCTGCSCSCECYSCGADEAWGRVA